MFTIEEFIEENQIDAERTWDKDKIETIEPTLKGIETDQVPGMDSAVVFGDPFALGETLDFQQGFDNPYGAFGTCGLTSIANVCNIGGIDITEPEVVEYAMENELCEKVEPGVMGGGVTTAQTMDILKHYGLNSHCEMAEVADCERLAECLEGGHGIILGVNSGVLQDREWKTYDSDGNVICTHYVTLTGTVRDSENGELKGFYLCDSSSSRPDGGAIYVSLDEMKKCYSDVLGAHAVITNEAIR